jgi:hypothetical protein
MIQFNDNHNICQMISGQGWRILIAVRNGDGGTGKAEVFECPVVAWVTHKTRIRNHSKNDRGPWKDVTRIDPLIRGSFWGGTGSDFLLFNNYGLALGVVYLAPGEARTPDSDSEAMKDLQNGECAAVAIRIMTQEASHG